MRIEDPGLIGNRRFSAFVKRTGSVAWKPAPSLAAALTVVAIAGKQACSLDVLGKGADRLSVGLGMIPRGEVDVMRRPAIESEPKRPGGRDKETHK